MKTLDRGGLALIATAVLILTLIVAIVNNSPPSATNEEYRINGYRVTTLTNADTGRKYAVMYYKCAIVVKDLNTQITLENNR